MSEPSSAENPFIGVWHIVSMSAWDESYFNEEVQAFIEFEPYGTGLFQFGYLRGEIDCKASEREGIPGVEFSWEGIDGVDGRSVTGRGWANVQHGELRGKFFIHLGEESEFAAKQAQG